MFFVFSRVENVHAGFHIEVAKGTLIEEANKIAEEVKEKVNRKTGCQHCVIHVDLTE
jgi:divalent metal cation (Fe/Co/Zn/Cd) transporter